MSDDEWSLLEHFILAIRAPNGRRVTSRYDKTAESYPSFVDITSIRP
jgi:hypothetical protein